jgi:hypothetical protein
VLRSALPVDPGANVGSAVKCPSGDIAIAGGAMIDPSVVTVDLSLVTLDSYNAGFFDSSTPTDTWVVDMTNLGKTTQSFQTQATCAPAGSLAAAAFAAKATPSSSPRAPR